MMTSRQATQKKLDLFRQRTFHTLPGKRLHSLEDAITFIEERGLITFWPIKGVDLPSLWTAVAGDRPVAEVHDDPGHVTWGWKDALLPMRRVYYGKYLRGKATFASLELLPYLYALSPRVADLDDYRLAYEAGHLTYEAYLIGEALLEHGPLHTIELRKRANMSSSAVKSRFDRALTDLQRGLWIVPVGIAEAGAWRYAYVYDLFDRWFERIPGDARPIRLSEARRTVLETCLKSVGTAQEADLARLLSWPIGTLRTALAELSSAGVLMFEDGLGWIHQDVTVASSDG
jgi:uncharacterized protein YcaQ